MLLIYPTWHNIEQNKVSFDEKVSFHEKKDKVNTSYLREMESRLRDFL